ncbi:DUF1294 domain-containing protein [Pseudidiomarina sediminum]|uniref:DUF1294 domain-containing protein n=1 Tax=Pseudidiomarina sediminum TaxID=431675 RepID=A0A432YZE6_9GAMM|nr:DUF1294 domain-containing protein [Pseudidiomarina sediminum]RUO68998.1 DUF1294 domain-containing protein [Pseudidiomarina sediminum]
MRRNGTLVKWNAAKGYGFVKPSSGGKELFAHVSAFSNRARTPKVGDLVTFNDARQDDGKLRAVDIDYFHTKLSFHWLPWFLLGAGYLAAVTTLGFMGRLPLELSYVFLFVSVVAYLAYAHDKHAATEGAQRVPENALHSLSLLGGWPGALLAQQQFRHKTKKTSFRWVFYFSVLVNVTIVATLAFKKTAVFGIIDNLSY